MKRSAPMLSCEDALARLWEYVDGELPPVDEAAVQRHLEVCSRCYPQYDFRRAYLAFAQRVQSRDQASAGLRRRLVRMILEQEARAGSS